MRDAPSSPPAGGPRSAARSRRRGATYTFLCIVFSMLLLIGASIHLRSVTHVDGLSALQARRSLAREAAFGGLRWAGRDAAATAGVATGAATLHLVGADVLVDWRRHEDGLTATARVQGQRPLKATGTFVRRGEALLLEQATVE